MRLHVITHVPYEGPGLIARWAAERGAIVTQSAAPDGAFPSLAETDLLVIMGGPMDADDHAASPWLTAEKRYVAQAVGAGARVLGVCLGAQILADALGGSVGRNPEKEIGFYPVRRTQAAAGEPMLGDFPDTAVVGHWHGDTFRPPPGSRPLLESDACANQAFSAADGRALGLQFHLEWTRDSLAELISACGDELAEGGRFVAGAEELLGGLDEHGDACRALLYSILDGMTSPRGERA